MNIRIRELREQAVKFAEVTYNNYTMATFDTNKSIETLFEEKFAELIVQECADVAAKVWYEQGLDIRGAELGKFMKRFNEQFGVEE